jgi:hypothetical protein
VAELLVVLLLLLVVVLVLVLMLLVLVLVLVLVLMLMRCFLCTNVSIMLLVLHTDDMLSLLLFR